MTAPVLMVQGTASNVGKSVVAAGLCRLLRRRGFRVAPFKALNLSLNAAVTADGGEIARSTAVQAAAAGVEPTVDMNPILLKPEAGLRSQLILRGKVRGTLQFGSGESVQDHWPVVADCLDRLRERFDVVVAEGSGSPAELNLRDQDVANMRVARHADAAVVLVGDVERGGVFAQLIGTLDLLPPGERVLVRGLVVNCFHGDPKFFAEGVAILERRTALPVFGVVPFVHDIDLPEEDAATLDRSPRRADRGAALRIAVIRLPHLANFDDFGPLERQPDVELRYVERPEEIASADLVILPGTKSTLADLEFVRQRGLAEAIRAIRANGTPIVGICGGFQMLGEWIHDPNHVESDRDGAAGLGVLQHSTVFEREKITQRVRARVLLDIGPLSGLRGCDVEGYEIHHGRTRQTGSTTTSSPLRIVSRSGTPADDLDGGLSDDDLVFGTYLHGLFDDERVRESLLAWLRSHRAHRSGDRPSGASLSSLRVASVADAGATDASEPGNGRDQRNPLADPHDRWADHLERALDLPLLLERCGLQRFGIEQR